MRYFLGRLTVVVVVCLGTPVFATDVPITGLKLIVVDKTVAAGKAKAVFVAKDPGVSKGAGTDPMQIEATLSVAYDAVSGTFEMPQGANWLVNKDTVAKYVNKAAPTDGAVKVGVIKPDTLVKVVGKNLGDTPLDISGAPATNVYVAETIVNSGEETRLCTQFTGCVHKLIAGDTGYKLICKGSSTGDAACTAAQPPASTTTTTTPASTTTTTTAPACAGTAAVLVNEVAPAITGGQDLVELLVTSGGPLAGITLEQLQSSTLLATLPAICAVTGDLVVVHLTPTGGFVSETASKSENPCSECYATAWDVAGEAAGITSTDGVLALKDAAMAFLDAAAFSDKNFTTTASFRSALATIQAAAQWLPADCGGITCSDVTTPTAENVSASWLGVGTSSVGNTVARASAGTDSNVAADWTVGSQTLGLPN